jgi:hypothetical protein
MNKLLLIGAVIIILIFAIVLELMQEKITDTPPNVFSNPNETIENNLPITPIPPSDTITLSVPAGSLSVRNFLQDADVSADSQNDGYFFLDNTVQTESEQNVHYTITYESTEQFFNVVLLKEPLRDSRLQAEEYLKSLLNITDQEMCQLKYTLSTPLYVSEQRSGIDFRFSFCEGAVTL